MPDANYPLNGLTGDPRVLRTDRTERIVRLLVGSDVDAVAAALTASGASGVRIVDLNLEDIFLYAVSPADATADVIARENA